MATMGIGVSSIGTGDYNSALRSPTSAVGSICGTPGSSGGGYIVEVTGLRRKEER